MSTYICSDLHGQYTIFNKMLKDIGFSEKDEMYILGDIIDRGPKSMRLLRQIMEMDNVTSLIGNHEFFMWDYVVNNGFHYGYTWLGEGNGGQRTEKQFRNLSKKEQQKILDYIGDMYLQVEIEKGGETFLLSHSSFISDRGTLKWKDINRRQVEEVVWYSPWRMYECEPLSYYQEDNKTHIIGHVPIQKILYDEYWKFNSEDEALKRANVISPHIETKTIVKDDGRIESKNYIIDIDGGGAFRSRKLFSKAGLICMNLDKYIEGENAFSVYNK